MTPQDSHHPIAESIGLAILSLLNYLVANYNAVAGNILVTLSVGYLIWKWRKDYLKSKKE